MSTDPKAQDTAREIENLKETLWKLEHENKRLEDKIWQSEQDVLFLARRLRIWDDARELE